MGQYRHVGTLTQIYDTPYSFKRWGQLVEMPDDIAEKCIDQGGQLIPASEFDAHGVTPDEIKQYSTIASHSKAPAPFIEKRNALWSRVAEIRQQRKAAQATLETDGAANEPASDQPTVVTSTK